MSHPESMEKTSTVVVVFDSEYKILINPFHCQMWPKAKFTNFIFLKLPGEITGREVSFEWSLHRISSTESKFKNTLQNFIILHSGSERVKMSPSKRIPFGGTFNAL